MDIREVLRDYVSDMLGVEKHCLESIKRQTRDEKFKCFPEAYRTLTKAESTLRTHTIALDQYLAAMEEAGAQSMLKKAATSAMGALSGFYGKLRPEDPVSRSLRDDYTALNHAAVSYTMLHTTACALNVSRIADLALQHLNDLTPLIVALSRVIPEVVAKELSAEGKLEQSAWHEALMNTQNAWNSEVTGRHH